MNGGRPGEESIGELIARERERLGKSQYTLAEELSRVCGRGDGVPDRSMVARWETGRRIPTPYWRTHLATVLQLPPAMLDRAAATAKARRSAYPQEDASDRLRYVLAHPNTVDLVSVAYLREQVQRLDERYDRVPSTILIPKAGQYLGQLAFLASHAQRAYLRRELQAAEAEAATLMAIDVTELNRGGGGLSVIFGAGPRAETMAPEHRGPRGLRPHPYPHGGVTREASSDRADRPGHAGDPQPHLGSA